jgi:hypothetical protein
MHSFRLDGVSSERLRTLSGQLGASQGELIEQLVNACYDSACVDFDVEGFKRFADRCREIKTEMSREFNDESLEAMQEIEDKISGKRPKTPQSVESLFKELNINVDA